MRRKVLRRHALWIAALILVVLISSAALVLLGAGHHHCPGQGCRLCAAVEQGARQLGIFSLILLAAFFAGSIFSEDEGCWRATNARTRSSLPSGCGSA